MAKARGHSLTKEEALQRVADLPPAMRATLDKYWNAYRALRAALGPHVHISREEVASAAKTRSIDMASKWMALIEPIEGDQPFQTRQQKLRGAPPAEGGEAAQHAPAVRAAFDAVAKALEGVSAVFHETLAAELADLTRNFQAVQQQQAIEFQEQRQIDEDRIADLEASAAGAGDQSWVNHEEAETLRTDLAMLKAETVAAIDRAAEADRAREIAQVQRDAAVAQVNALKDATSTQSAEVLRLQQELQGKDMLVARVIELVAENRALMERVEALSHQIARLDALIADADQRHEQERVAIRAACTEELAEERTRSKEREAKLLEWFGAPAQRDGGRSS